MNDTPPTTPIKHAGNTPYRLLDAWRGVAALWVVMLHIRLYDTPTSLFIFSAGGHLGVPMFFIISGYCIANAATRSLSKPQPVLAFCKARLRRIYPPYLFASLLAAALSIFLTFLIRHHIVQASQIADLHLFSQGWRFYLGALTFTQMELRTGLMIAVFWSLCYEVLFYELVAVILACALWAKKPAWILDALNVLTISSLIWLDLAGDHCPFPWNLWPQFGLGALVYQILSQPKRKLPRLVFALCSAFVMIYAYRFGAGNFSDGITNGFQAFFYLGFAIVLLALFRWDDQLSKLRITRVFAWVGMFSYSLYLIHLLALGIVTQGINRIHFIGNQPLLFYLVKFALCIAVGRLFFHFCERPFIDTRQRQARQEAERKNLEPIAF